MRSSGRSERSGGGILVVSPAVDLRRSCSLKIDFSSCRKSIVHAIAEAMAMSQPEIAKSRKRFFNVACPGTLTSRVLGETTENQ